MEGHSFDNQNEPNRLTLSNIINLTVEYDLFGLRTKYHLKFRRSKFSM